MHGSFSRSTIKNIALLFSSSGLQGTGLGRRLSVVVRWYSLINLGTNLPKMLSNFSCSTVNGGHLLQIFKENQVTSADSYHMQLHAVHWHL